MDFEGIINYDYNHFTHWNWENTRPDLPNQGILIWAHKKYPNYYGPQGKSDPSWAYVIQADGFNNANTKHNCAVLSGPDSYGDSGDPFPGFWDVNVISPWSFPASLDIGPSPSTLLSNTVGFEITEMGYDYIAVDLYYVSPEDASPAMPRFLEVSEQNNHPYLTWYANTEPDLRQYKVYKKKGSDPFSFYCNVNKRVSYMVDYNEDVIVGPHQANESLAQYKVTAEDNDYKESNYSNTVEILVEGGGFEKPIIFTENQIIPEQYSISQNYPNPFNPETNIRFGIPKDNFVNLVVYDIQGQKIITLVNDQLSAGSYSVKFNGTNLPSGIYICKITAGTFSDTKRMLLIK